jgi:uncharacterized membrane protein YozB (DUF420 family)
MDYYTILATASLIIQIVVILMLVYGFFLKRQKKFKYHGITMGAAVILHLAMILAIMIPSFLVVVPEFILPAPLEINSIVGLIHGVTGTIAAILGVFLIAAWHFSKDLTGCFKRKDFMRYTIIIWTIALILGIVLYAIFYGQLLLA